LGEIELCKFWSNASSSVNTVDYYRQEATDCCDWPETPFGIVNAHSQNSFVGLPICGKSNSSTRAYLQQQLESPLQVGKKYKVKFFICNGEPTAVSTSGLATSDIGVLFTSNAIAQTQQWPIIGEPQFKIDSVFYSKSWKEVSFIYTPEENMNTITIGLFGSDVGKSIVNRFGSDPQFAYYYFDDFSITCINDNLNPDISETGKIEEEIKPGEVFIPNSFSPNGDGKNDLFTPIGNEVHFLSLKVFSRWGEVVFESKNGNFNWNGSNGKVDLEIGTYYWVLEYTSTTSGSKSIQKSGYVMLMR